MIFQHTIDKVLSGEKTQTRRIVKSGDECSTVLRNALAIMHTGYHIGDIAYVYNGKRDVYIVGKDYAVQRGRGVKAEARIRITAIRREDVRNISEADVKAEGFDDCVEFFLTWVKMHDKALAWPVIPDYDTGMIKWSDMQWELGTRPDERYAAWVIEFELVKGAQS